ncbi:MAG: DUF4358 domain-containing protein [Angelakisella sp.]
MNNNLKKILTAATALLMITALAACGSKPSSSSSSTATPPSSSSVESSMPESKPEAADPAATAKKYAEAIVAARDEEMNKYNPVFTNDKASALPLIQKGNPEFTEEHYASQFDMLLPLMGFTVKDAETYAISASMINTRAYGIAVVKPAAGKETVVETGLKAFIEMQQNNFKTYLVDQYEVAKAAKLEKLDDGTFVLVMSENGDAIYDAIVKSLTAK